jgi:hypothetical protein
MNELNYEKWPALRKNDDLSSRATGDAYSDDGSFANTIAAVPAGLRAMAATHWLDGSSRLLSNQISAKHRAAGYLGVLEREQV